MSQQQKKYLSIPYSETIWKSEIDPLNDLIILELRSGDERRTELSAVDLNTGKILWTKGISEESWWYGLVKCINGIVLVHLYKDAAHEPTHKGIIALDAFSGNLLWKNDEASIIDTGTGSILVAIQMESDNSQQTLDLATGEEIKEKIDLVKPEFPLLLPLRYHEGVNGYADLIEFLSDFQSLTISGPVEYLEYNSKIVLGYYIYENLRLTNFILVTDSEGNEILHEKLADKTKGTGFDVFFVYKSLLIFVREKKELCIYELGYE